MPRLYFIFIALFLTAAARGGAAQTVTASPKPPTAAECVELFTRNPELAKPRPPPRGLYGEDQRSEKPVPGTPEAMAEACHELTGKENRGVFGDVPGPNYLERDQPDFSETMSPTLDPKMRALQQLRTAERLNGQALQFARRGEWATALRLFEYAAQYAPHDIRIRRNIAEARNRLAAQQQERRLQRLQR